MVNRANGTRANSHRANGVRADVVAPYQQINILSLGLVVDFVLLRTEKYRTKSSLFIYDIYLCMTYYIFVIRK